MQSYDIRTLQLRLLRILKAFDIMCRNHGLRYYLEYGTLLGAVPVSYTHLTLPTTP